MPDLGQGSGSELVLTTCLAIRVSYIRGQAWPWTLKLGTGSSCNFGFIQAKAQALPDPHAIWVRPELGQYLAYPSCTPKESWFIHILVKGLLNVNWHITLIYYLQNKTESRASKEWEKKKIQTCHL